MQSLETDIITEIMNKYIINILASDLSPPRVLKIIREINLI